MVTNPASLITKVASKQTYYTVRFLVDRDRVDDAYRAYGYFRWVDDILDADSGSASKRRAFVERQKSLLESCYRGEFSRDVDIQENMLVELVRHDQEKNSGLQTYLRYMMLVIDFDAGRRGRLISQTELNDYTLWLAIAVTEAMHYFIGHDDFAPQDETRYLAVSAAHIIHMLRDTYDDVQAGYFNIPREVLDANAIGPGDVHSDAYRAWVMNKAIRRNHVRRALIFVLLLFDLISLVGCGQASATTPTVISTEASEIPATITETPTAAPTITGTPSQMEWEAKMSSIKWVAYTPTNADPNKGIEPSRDSIIQDLAVLQKAGFTGLVTYGSTGIIGRDLPQIVQEQGFSGLIVGVWDPNNQSEITAAKAAAQYTIVLGYYVGNEGLNKRYQFSRLSSVIDDLRSTTGRRVTTTEEIDDYTDEALLALGDWVFPNAHPYFHSQIKPDLALQWTRAAYEDIFKRAGRFVMFKEVGLPTAGDMLNQLSEANQEQYYLGLANSEVKFVYFEAFDQTWKNTLPVEPNWGIFKADRTPKLLGYSLLGEEPPPTATPVDTTFYVYGDLDSPGNHFAPSGYMGDIGDIKMDTAYTENTHSGNTAIRVTYLARGKGPNNCNYLPPCNWAGVYWQQPPNNWGDDPAVANTGFDLSSYKLLAFWARADQNAKIEFKVGGIIGPYGDSLQYPRSKLALLNTEWQQFEIPLDGADLSYIIGDFAWVSTHDQNPNGATFYLDDIRFEK